MDYLSHDARAQSDAQHVRCRFRFLTCPSIYLAVHVSLRSWRVPKSRVDVSRVFGNFVSF